MTRAKQTTAKLATIRSIRLSASTIEALERISQEAGDFIGRPISGSAAIRALLTYADRQGSAWLREHLFPAIEAEIQSGTTWGRRKEK